jgi:spermidine synthase
MENTFSVKNDWFLETCPLWPGMGLSLEIEKILYSKKSRFQQIDVYQTTHHGRMLAIDGIIQLTESDEFAYQEMLAHIPLFAHPHPETVLVIGGGDGGILREINRHDCVLHIDFCEIDEEVIKVSRKFLPGLAGGFDDPRITTTIGDGYAYVLEKKNQYDVIIVDSSDPLGPGDVLFKKPFYEGLKAALKPGGIIATQGESIFLHQDLVTDLARMTSQLFTKQAYACIMIPTYPGGSIGICLGSLGPDLKQPARKIPDSLQAQLKYYSPGIHEASFVLPYFAQKMLETICM